MACNFDYFYWQEAGQFTFYRIPKTLFTDQRFSDLSTDAKLLYGLMLDRMGLSVKNSWFDEQGRVYIYFTLEDAGEFLQFGHNKLVKLFAELDADKGVGLIERRKQGQGRPTVIYVKNFASPENTGKPPAEKEKPKGGAAHKHPDFLKSEVKTSQKQKSALPFLRSADFLHSNASDIDLNKIETNDLSIRDGWMGDACFQDDGCHDRLGSMEACRETVLENIEYSFLRQRYNRVQMNFIDELVELMVCTVSGNRPTVKIGSEEYPSEYVKKRMLRIDSGHIEYLLASFAENTTEVRNIKAYLLTSLFNAPATIESFYAAMVQHDLSG